MAYAALVSLGHVLDQILDHDLDFLKFIFHAKQQIASLRDNIVSLVAFLDDFPEDVGAMLEGRIRDAANLAEDIVECRILDEIRWDDGCWGVMYCVRQVILFVLRSHRTGGGNGLKVRHWRKLNEELQHVMKEFEVIVEEVMQIKARIVIKDPTNFHASTRGSSSSRFALSGKGNAIVGLDQDLWEVKDRLCREQSRLEIIPITGMGGIGKTTLARYAYDDPLVVEWFDVRAWVTISQDYDTKKILSDILYSMDLFTGESNEKLSEDKLLEHLHKSLMGRRYFIVMDDVWDESVWDALRRIFPDDSNGSRIMITSRHLDVAKYVDRSNHPHEMKLMDTDQSWNLLREKVFAQEHCPLELEQIGMFIAEKCRGLPLAIVVIAGILSNANRMQGTWESIAGNVNNAVNSTGEMFTEILSLSYNHLPHRLRPCFLYMGGFREDYEIKTAKLVKLWVAEGFLKSNKSNNLEKVAEEYLEDLVKRSLVLVVKKKSNGDTKVVKIHDLLRDLCIKIALEEKFLQVVYKDSCKDIENPRRLSMFSLFLGDIQSNVASSIRTILLPIPGSVLESLKSFKLLRILDAFGLRLEYFPIQIGQLFHLRYLAFTFYPVGIFKVPPSLSKLRNLQTLIIMPFGHKREFGHCPN